MIFVVLHKYLNCAVDKTIDTGHNTSSQFNTNYRIILWMKLFITPWCKPLKTDAFKKLYI